MTLGSELLKHGISILTIGDRDTAKIDCPQHYCKTNRGKDNSTPLRVDLIRPYYVEWRCSHCLWSGHIGEKPIPKIQEAANEKTPVAAPKAPEMWPTDAFAYLTAKGMTEEDALAHNLSWDDRRKCIKIPYLENGKVINSLLIRPQDGKSRLENGRIVFWGLGKIPNNSEPLTIVQRETDAILLIARGFKKVIAVPNGGDIKPEKDDFDQDPDKFGYLSACAEAAKGWLEIRFVFDDTKQGLALRQELSRRLGPGRCSAAKLTRGTVLETYKEMGSETLCADINEAKPLPIFGLFNVDQFEKELEAYFDYGMDSGVPTGWPNVDKIYTVVPGQLTVITGIPNSGKSEWVDALAMNLALNHGWRFAAFSPENGKEAHATKLIEKRVEQSADPKAHRRMGKDTFLSGAKWVGNHFTFIESTDTMPTLDWILDRAKDAALRYGIKGLIIDPWNRIEKKLGERQSETDYVAESIPKILRFLVNYGVHGWLVVHPKQQQPDHKTGKIRAPSLYDMAGSAHFVNMCDNGVVIHRSESIDDTTEVLVRKVRFKYVGRRGDTKLRYIRATGRYEPLDEEMTPEQAENAQKLAAANNGEEDHIRTYEVD